MVLELDDGSKIVRHLGVQTWDVEKRGGIYNNDLGSKEGARVMTSVGIFIDKC